MLEREIENFLNENIKKLGGRAYKFVSPGNRGVPDRMILLPGGRIIFVELKTKDRYPTKLQRAQIKRMRDLGADVRVIRGMDAAKDFLDELA